LHDQDLPRMTVLSCGGRPLDLSRPRVMGVLNVTPDSFSDGGAYLAAEQALKQARRMAGEGAAVIDVGGESTRPGAADVPIEEELRRVVPVIEAVAAELDVVVSVDTSKPEVMRAAVAAGAGLVNDVRALRAPGALEAAAELGVPVCLMHMQGEPRTMQRTPRYDDVVGEVVAFLSDRIAACEAAGITRERLLVDPGIGFGKTVEHNLGLLKHLDALSELELPVLLGVSRKSFIGAVLDRAVEERLYGSLALAALGAWQGAALVRAHDVAATADVLAMCQAVRDAT